MAPRAAFSSAVPARLISGCGRRKVLRPSTAGRGLAGFQAAGSSPLGVFQCASLHTRTQAASTAHSSTSFARTSSSPSHAARRTLASAATSAASPPTSISTDPTTALASLLPFFNSSSVTTSDPIWAGRLSSALASSSSNVLSGVDPSKEVLILRLRDDERQEEGTDVLAALLEDGMVDHTGRMPVALAEARRSLPKDTDLIVRYGQEVRLQERSGVLEVPLPWLKDTGVVLREVQDSDLSASETLSAIYLASQVIVSCSYSALFTPRPSPWLQQLGSVLRTFADHPGLRLTISHNGEAAAASDRTRAAQQISRLVASSAITGVPRLAVDFIDTAKVRHAQEALREAMGFPALSSHASSSSAASQNRTNSWSEFQSLSTESGLPALVSSLVASSESHEQEHLHLLVSHAAEEIATRLSLARTDLDEMRSWASWLESSAKSDASHLVDKILSSTPSVTKQPPHSGNEPPLLPKWWKLPFIGDVEARERIHVALEREWLGGKETEERLIWWGGRLRELQSKEQKEMEELVTRLQKGQQLPNEEGEEAGAAASSQSTIKTKRTDHLRSLPPSRILEMRSASLANLSSPNVDLNNPTVLAQPIIRARDHFFGRNLPPGRRAFAARPATPVTTELSGGASAGLGPSPQEGGVSILDSLQRRIQSSIFRFYATTGLAWSIAGWGLASHELFPYVERTAAGAGAGGSSSLLAVPSAYLTDLLSLPSFDPSTSLGIALLGSTYALWSLQRSHARISSRLLTRDLLTRIPANARAGLQERAEEVAMQGVFGWRAKIGGIVREWCELEGKVLREERRSWESIKPTIAPPSASVQHTPTASSNASSSVLPGSPLPHSTTSRPATQQARLFSTSAAAARADRPERPAHLPPRRDPNKPPSRHRLYYREVLPAWIKCITYAGLAYGGCHAAWYALDALEGEGVAVKKEKAK